MYVHMECRSRSWAWAYTRSWCFTPREWAAKSLGHEQRKAWECLSHRGRPGKIDVQCTQWHAHNDMLKPLVRTTLAGRALQRRPHQCNHYTKMTPARDPKQFVFEILLSTLGWDHLAEIIWLRSLGWDHLSKIIWLRSFGWDHLAVVLHVSYP